MRRTPTQVADIALRELDVDIAVRRADLEALERCRAILVRTRDVETCDLHAAGNPCRGPRWARWCRACGTVIRRCHGHGGLEAATVALDAHKLEHASVPTSTNNRITRKT